MKIIITHSALLRLRKIHAYYISRVSMETADKIRHTIFKAIEILKENPEAGSIEENLQDLHLGHRRLVEDHYKIIYRIEDRTVYMTDVPAESL